MADHTYKVPLKDEYNIRLAVASHFGDNQFKFFIWHDGIKIEDKFILKLFVRRRFLAIFSF